MCERSPLGLPHTQIRMQGCPRVAEILLMSSPQTPRVLWGPENKAKVRGVGCTVGAIFLQTVRNCGERKDVFEPPSARLHAVIDVERGFFEPLLVRKRLLHEHLRFHEDHRRGFGCAVQLVPCTLSRHHILEEKTVAPFLRIRGKQLAPAMPAIHSVDGLRVLALGASDDEHQRFLSPMRRAPCHIGQFGQSCAQVLAHIAASCRAMARDA